MEGYVCGICGFVSINGQAPEKCPVCGAPKSEFDKKPDAVKTPLDSNNLNDSEKKHVPVVMITKKCGLIPDGCVDANIKIGEVVHAMTPEHFIGYIDVYIDKEFVSRTHLTPDKLNPAVGLHLKVNSGKIAVVEWCNIHGNWFAEKEI